MAQFETMKTTAGVRASTIDTGLRAHMNKVYGTMSIGMLITGLAAWAISGLAVTDQPTQYAMGNGEYLTQLGYLIYATPLKWVMFLLPLAMVFGFGAAANRLSASGLGTYFFAYAAAMGVSLSSIFLIYTGFSIVQIFLITAIAFASLSMWGYTTKKDISAWGSFLIMGVVGLIVAMIVNIFMQSEAIMFAISAIGVLIFAGLTAYDTQKIKTDYIQHAATGDSEWLGKAAVMGALTLYLDFINMFIFMLQLFGNRE
ncbi:Bax inhibitor-1/YccA family protein [Yoonia sp.]|uniref:Bax inhibitor-1/YccA family protein n=1 Tax=Yoonia sp. TaxID=2212373 RepID=UPI0019F00C28|nr:Bax inhibitor-1/YccA family protein [Yoonia sp.]MBE0412504.1 Bax inhibitor-1/YccA family protein [Yoonia sp.]